MHLSHFPRPQMSIAAVGKWKPSLFALSKTCKPIPRHLVTQWVTFKALVLAWVFHGTGINTMSEAFGRLSVFLSMFTYVCILTKLLWHYETLTSPPPRIRKKFKSTRVENYCFTKSSPELQITFLIYQLLNRNTRGNVINHSLQLWVDLEAWSFGLCFWQGNNIKIWRKWLC